MNDSRTRAALDLLGSTETFVPDWRDVLTRADVLPELDPAAQRPPRRFRRRVLVLTVLIALLIPLATVAAGREWWFLNVGSEPTSDVVVVRAGKWDGHEWQIAAFKNANGAICFSLTPAEHATGGVAAAMACSTLEPHGISLLAGRVAETRTGYVIGPAADSVREVQIRLKSGIVLRTETFAIPPSLGDLRFYAVEVPPSELPLPEVLPPRAIVGLDSSGRSVACLSDADDDTERLSATCP